MTQAQFPLFRDVKAETQGQSWDSRDGPPGNSPQAVTTPLPCRNWRTHGAPVPQF